ncbi:MAG: transketolase [Bacteroidetes bacterium]|nr:transketolase [Bacteroidota bacterium]
MTYEQILYNLVSRDERFVVLTAENRAAIRNLPGMIGNRFIDTGITEMTLVGMSAGLALRGRIPVSHALATFLTMRAFEFIRTDVGISGLPVKLVGGVPGLLSEANGPTHQAIEDVSIMRGIPGMNVFCPADEDDMLKCIEQILLSPSPYYIRYNGRKTDYRHSSSFKEGKAEVISTGKDINILTYGTLFKESLETMEILERRGLRTGLVNLRTLKPVDEGVLLDSLTNYSYTVTIEDHFMTGGLFSIVSETAMKNGKHGRVIPIAFENKWFKPALFEDVLEYEKLTPPDLAERIFRTIDKNEKQN